MLIKKTKNSCIYSYKLQSKKKIERPTDYFLLKFVIEIDVSLAAN